MRKQAGINAPPSSLNRFKLGKGDYYYESKPRMLRIGSRNVKYSETIMGKSVKASAVSSLTLLILFLFSPAALSHVPLNPEGNGDISSAVHISDPGKSWAIYGFLGPNATQYYSFDLEQSEQIFLSLLKSTDNHERYFQPEMALLGPGVKTAGQLPRHVILPQNAKDFGILVVAGKNTSNATYEPFGPSSFIEVAVLDMTAPESGRYYVAVYNNATPGHYALTVGTNEEFSFSERITMPIRLMSVYLWEGQSLSTILIPYLVAEIIGLLIFWRSSRRTAFRLAGTLSGFLFLATSASVFTQMVFSLTRAPFGPEVYISLAVAVFHALLGVISLHLAGGEAGILQRVLLAVIGTMALLAGSGLIMGPVLAIAASILPSMRGSMLKH